KARRAFRPRVARRAGRRPAAHGTPATTPRRSLRAATTPFCWVEGVVSCHAPLPVTTLAAACGPDTPYGLRGRASWWYDGPSPHTTHSTSRSRQTPEKLGPRSLQILLVDGPTSADPYKTESARWQANQCR